jgi:hypothetical protein
VKLGQGSATWARRGLLAVVLLGAAIIPGRATSQAARHCAGYTCKAAGSILWTKRLPGSWVVQNGVGGTVPGTGQAYAASAGTLAVLGYGTKVTGYQARTGRRAWHTALAGFPPGSAIVSVRAWPAAVAVGVSVPAGSAGQVREEVILTAAGRQLRSFPAAEYGGAVRADRASTVIIGRGAVTSYANSTGRVLWRRSTGNLAQTWLVSGPYLYLAQTAGGSVSSAPVTALRRIDLLDGAQRVIRPARDTFEGTLTAIAGGVILFSGGNGLSAYDSENGLLRWHRAGAVPELVDSGRQLAYIESGTGLVALNLRTNRTQGRHIPPVSAGLFAIRDGVGLGLDQGILGAAWGYNMASRRVVWSSAGLPWPHFFADLTGLGGSVSSGSVVTLLTICPSAGAPARGGSAACRQPELAAVRY